LFKKSPRIAKPGQVRKSVSQKKQGDFIEGEAFDVCAALEMGSAQKRQNRKEERTPVNDEPGAFNSLVYD
jgi:hypothetical protein